MQNDYIDFKFGDHWASEFNLLAVSSSDRYTPPVYGSVNPNIATIMGKKGVYKWKTQVNEKIFNINIAFNSVTIAQLNQIKQWLQPNKIQKLIFSEEPYKYYWAALNAEIDFSHLPFVEGEKQVGERTIIEGVYKGEMVISFVCIDNDGYSTEGTFEGLEAENPSNTIKGNNFVLTDADNDYIEDLKIEGKSEQETKYNNTLSDTDFADVNSRSVEKAWKTNNLAQIQAENEEVTISAPYQYSGIAQEQREALIDHKYFASAEVNTDSLDTALEIAGKNITNSIEGKDINITDGLVGPVDDLVVSGDASQDKLYNNEINSSFLEDLDNWEEINEADLSRKKQTAIIESDKKYGAATQKTEESNIGDKYYLSTKIKADSVDTVLEVETEKGNAEGSNITINDASDNKMRDFKLYGKSQQDNYEEEVLGEGEYITYNNNDNYDKYTKIEVNGNSAQEVIEEVLPTIVEGESVTAQDITLPKGRIGVYGNSKQESRSGKNILDINSPEVHPARATVKIEKNKINATSTGDTATSVVSIPLYVKPNTDYTFSGMAKVLSNNLEEATSTYVKIREQKNGGNWVSGGEASINQNSTQEQELNFNFNSGEHEIVWAWLYLKAGAVTGNISVDFTNLQVEEGNTATDYEQYRAMPSPEYPSLIKILGDNTNLFNALDNFSARTIIGLTVTPISNDSIIKINGTATADTFSFIGNDIIDIFENGKTYYAYTNNENFEVLFELYGVDVEVPIKTVNNFIMSSEYTIIKLILRGKNLNGKTYNNEEIGIKIEEGKITNYTSYEQGSTKIKITNENIANINEIYTNMTSHSRGNCVEETVDGRDCLRFANTRFRPDVDNPFNLINYKYKEKTAYTFRILAKAGKQPEGVTGSGALSFQAIYTDGSKVSATKHKADATSFVELRFVTDPEKTIARVGFNYGTSCQWYMDKSSVFIAEGDTTNYIEHQEKNYILPIQKPMLEGDYFDFKKGKEIHNWEKVILDGTEPWGLSTLTNYQWFRWSLSGVRLRSDFICTHLKTYDGIGSSSANYIGITNNSTPNRIYIAISKDITTVEQLKEYLAELKANNNPIVVYYQKTEIEELPLTEEQIEIGEQIAETELFLDTTNIYSNDEIAPNFKLEYNYVLPSPSPEVPSEIQNVEGNIPITVCNKNLGNAELLYEQMKEFNSTYVRKEIVDDKECIVFNNSIYRSALGFKGLLNRYKKQTRYIVRGKFRVYNTSITSGAALYFAAHNSNNESIGYNSFSANGENWIQFSFLTNVDSDFSYIAFSYGTGALWCLDIDSFEIYEYRGTTKEDYIKNNEQTIRFPLQEGQKLMLGDYLDDDGIHHVRKQIELDGTEDNWVLNGNFYDIATQITLRGLTGIKAIHLCTHFINGQVANGMWLGASLNFLPALETGLTTLEVWKAFLAQQKQAGTPVILEYELAEEEIEAYTEEQQEAYSLLSYLTLYEGYNIIYSPNEIKPQLKWKIPESPSPDYFIEIENISSNNLVGGELTNGVLSASGNISFENINMYRHFRKNLKAGTYVYSFKSKSPLTQIRAVNLTIGEDLSITNNSFTIENDAEISFTFRKADNTDWDLGENLEDIEFKLEEGNIITDYEPKGIKININGKNMVDINNIAVLQASTVSVNKDKMTVSSSGDTLGYASILLNNFKPNTDYTFSGIAKLIKNTVPDESYSSYVGVRQAKNGGSWISRTTADISKETTEEQNLTFTFNSGKYTEAYLWLYLKSVKVAGEVTVEFSNLMVEEGNTKTNYTPLQSKVVVFPFNDNQKLFEGDYLASDGIHHVRKQLELDGTEAWELRYTTKNYCTFSTHLETPYLLSKDVKALCTHYKYFGTVSTVANMINRYKDIGFALYNNSESSSNTPIYINTTQTTLEGFKIFLAEQKEAGTPVIVEYELAKEEIEPYTEAQQEAYNQLCTHREITYIQTTNKFQPNMQIEYTKKPQYQSQLTVANTQQTLSLIYQTNIDDTRILISNIDSNPNTIEFTNPVLINLTKTFGEGKEPTKDWCDQNLTFFKCEEGGAPSIETSSRIKTVGGNINLFDPDNHIEFDGQYRGLDGGIYTNSELFGLKIPVLGNTVYSVNSNLSRNQYHNFGFLDKKGKYMWGLIDFTKNNKTFRTPKNCGYVYLAINKNYDWFTLSYGEVPIQKVNYGLANIDMQISGYDNQFKSFPLAEGQELLQLSDGTQDTLEADGIHKRVGKLIVTGNEKWGQYNRQLHTYFGAAAHIAGANGPIFCNRLINNNTYVYNTAGEAAACLQENYLYMCIKRKDFGANDNMSVDECLPLFIQFLKDEYSKGNPFIYYYRKAEEEIIPYSNAQKAWYDDFEIYRKNTQITTIAETKPWYSFTYDINDTYSVNSTKVNEYEKLGLIFNNLEDRPRFIVNRTADGSGTIKMRKPLVVDLTNAFGAGKEPDLAWCLENITFDNSCEYGTPSPNVPSELVSVGSNPIKIENKSRNLIKEQNLLNWAKEYCTAERLTEKYNNRNIYRISFENHKKGTISTRIQQKKGNMVLSIYARVIQADDPTVNRLAVAKVTSDSSSSTPVSYKSLENLIGEWQKIYIPITAESISDAAELVLEVQHNADTDDSTVIDLCMPQLEEGFTPHDYIPYAPEKVNNLIFTTPLRQLKNGVRDELSKDGIIRRIGEHTIKSTDTVYWIVFNQDKDYVTICGKLGIYIRGDDVWKSPSFYCNRIEDCTCLYAINQGGGTPSSRTKEGIGIIDSEYRMCLRADLMGIVETDTEEDMIRKYKVLLDEKPFTIYYEKEVADIEPLTELQKNTLANLVTRKQYDHWLISGDLNPEVELTYKLTSSINDIHPWVTGSNLLDKTWFYNDNNIHTKPYVEVDTGDADKSGISATRPIYLLNSGTETANLSLTFDYINIETPLTIQTYSGKFTDDGFVEEAKVSEITIEPFTNYQPFKDIYDNNPANWKIEIDSTLGEVYLRHNTDETKVLNLNRFNKNHTFLSLADCNFVDYDKVFPTIISEIEGTAIENTIFNKVIVANTADNYRLKNVNVEWKHTYL